MPVELKQLPSARDLQLIKRLLVGLYVWALLLSMEVFDFIDIDIEPGEAAVGYDQILAHGQNLLAMVVLLGGIAGAAHSAWRKTTGDK